MNFRWNHLHEGKRVRHVFTDFDDTIAHDASSDMGPEGFNRLVGPSTTKQHFAFNVLKNAASKLDKNKRNKVGIVTARHKSVIPHLRKWLHDREVPNAEKIKIHAVGHLTNPLPADEIARRKVKAIGSHVRKGEIRKGDEVHFFDDAKPNVDAVASMRHKGVRFRSVGVGPGRKTKLKEQRMKITKKKSDAEATRIFPTGTEKQNRPNKSFETFVSEMFHVLEGAKWIPLNPAQDPERAERLLADRRKKSEEAARNANAANASAWHTGGWSKQQKINALRAGNPGMSHDEAKAKVESEPKIGRGRRRRISEEKNKGHGYEDRITGGLKKAKLGGEGSSKSGRGSDAGIGTINVRKKNNKNKKQRSLEIKGEGSAYGQVRFDYHPKKGWHYSPTPSPGRMPKVNTAGMNAKELKKHEERVKRHRNAVATARMSRNIARQLHGLGAHHGLASHYGTPKDTSKAGIIRHVEAVNKKRKEFTHPITASPGRIARLLHTTMNRNDMVQKQNKGVYALDRRVERETGIPSIAKKIDRDAALMGDVASVRHRSKRRNKDEAKRAKGIGTTLTAQVNVDTRNIEPSNIDVEYHALGRKTKNPELALHTGKGKKRTKRMNESHNIETLKNITTSRLRKLHAKYKTDKD